MTKATAQRLGDSTSACSEAAVSVLQGQKKPYTVKLNNQDPTRAVTKSFRLVRLFEMFKLRVAEEGELNYMDRMVTGEVKLHDMVLALTGRRDKCSVAAAVINLSPTNSTDGDRIMVKFFDDLTTATRSRNEVCLMFADNPCKVQLDDHHNGIFPDNRPLEERALGLVCRKRTSFLS